MLESIDYDRAVRMLRAAAEMVRGDHERLSKLDSVGGDGDHGTTMLRAMACLDKAVDASTPGNLQALLYDVGWAILGVDGGATGPLLGTLFMSMSASVGDRATLDAAGLAAAVQAGLAGVRAQTKAQVGDKTMIDALAPATEAILEAAGRSADIEYVLSQAVVAADTGAVGTAQMQAKFGRARNIKEKSIGTQDPGATSVALIFFGLWKGVNDHA